MGFGRKVGAFLGLVPEDGHAGQHGEYDPAYPADYRSDQYEDFEGAEYAGEYGRDYGSEYAGTAARGADHRGADDRGADHRGTDHLDGGYAADRSGDRYNSRVDSRFDGGRSGSGFADAPLTQGALAMQPIVAPRRDPESKTGSRPVTIKLTGFSEARVIGEKYRDGLSVIMDMTEMADADARRLVDFAAGLAFAMRGSIDKVTTKVFMLLPSDIDAADISAEQRREFVGASGR
ncbi:MAG: cell division protein SepF [Nakamurella sp.]